VAGTAKREREREIKTAKIGAEGLVLANFGPEFLLLQAMKCTPIYRRWKRDILSLMVPNLGL